MTIVQANPFTDPVSYLKGNILVWIGHYPARVPRMLRLIAQLLFVLRNSERQISKLSKIGHLACTLDLSGRLDNFKLV